MAKKRRVIGIDLGTTNSCVAVMDHFLEKRLSEVTKIFKKHSFENQISRAYEGTIHTLLAQPYAA